MLEQMLEESRDTTFKFLRNVASKVTTIDNGVVTHSSNERLTGIHLIIKLLEDGAAIQLFTSMVQLNKDTYKTNLKLNHLGYQFKFVSYLTNTEERRFSSQDYVLALELDSIVVSREVSDKHIDHTLTPYFTSIITCLDRFVAITEEGIYINYKDAQRVKVGMEESSPLLATYLTKQLGGNATFNIKDFPKYIESIRFL